jgi:hypothetical protein
VIEMPLVNELLTKTPWLVAPATVSSLSAASWTSQIRDGDFTPSASADF